MVNRVAGARNRPRATRVSWTRRTLAAIGGALTLFGAALGATGVGLATNDRIDDPLPVIIHQDGKPPIQLPVDTCPADSDVLSSRELTSLEEQAEAWTNLDIPDGELEAVRAQLVGWLDPLERTAEQHLGCDAEEDIQRARQLV